MNTLKLVLDFKWFDCIAAGKKLEEYREIKPFWERLGKNEYTHVAFQRGYTGVWISFEVQSIEQGLPNPDYCNPEMIGKLHWVISFKPFPCVFTIPSKGEVYGVEWSIPDHDWSKEVERFDFIICLKGDKLWDVCGQPYTFYFSNNPPSVEYATEFVDKFLQTYKE